LSGLTLTVQFPYLDTLKVFKKCGEGGVGIHLASVYGSANTTSFVFSDEGPRSRRYGRTAASRLLVQPCDEDDNDDYYFLSVS
jgi:hypothetical protein